MAEGKAEGKSDLDAKLREFAVALAVAWNDLEAEGIKRSGLWWRVVRAAEAIVMETGPAKGAAFVTIYSQAAVTVQLPKKPVDDAAVLGAFLVVRALRAEIAKKAKGGGKKRGRPEDKERNDTFERLSGEGRDPAQIVEILKHVYPGLTVDMVTSALNRRRKVQSVEMSE